MSQGTFVQATNHDHHIASHICTPGGRAFADVMIDNPSLLF
ncbi:hypothetical protein B932_1530 [Gluconobacter oxydans H24]|nr:hypothetical protein B932_1530 [Gluconobacter oxydans H24]